MSTDTRSDLDRMVDNQNALDNLRGVIADLDDGGLTDDEALEKLRELLGTKKPLTHVVLSYVYNATVTVDLIERSVTEVEINYDYPARVEDQPPETRKEGAIIDPVLYADEIARAIEIATAAENTGDWPEPVRQ